MPLTREVVSSPAAAMASVQDCSCERPNQDTSPSGAISAHVARPIRSSTSRADVSASGPSSATDFENSASENSW